MGELSITPSEVDGVALTIKVELVGAIDAESIQDLTNYVDKLYEEGTAWFLVDMRGIKYVNSTGLGQLVHYADRFTARGGGMVLYALPPKVKVIIKMLGLDSFFPIVNSLDDALRTIEEQAEAAPPEPEKPSPPSAPSPHIIQPAQSVEADMSQENLLNLIQSLTEEQKRTNRLLKAVILELRQLREELDED